MRPASLALLLALSACRAEPPDEPSAAGEAPAQTDPFVMTYGDRQVYAYADPSLGSEVARLFALLDDLRRESVELSPRTRLPIGWTTLSFVPAGAAGERLVVHEPDYDGDPEAETRADISVSLAVLARQRSVLERAGVAGEPVGFDQHVLTLVGALEREELLMLRVASPGGRLTGWRVVPLEGIAEDDELESLPVHEVLHARPRLLDAMLLPSGYIAIYAGDELRTVVDGQDEVVWDASWPEQAPRGEDEPLLPDFRPGLDAAESDAGPAPLLPELGD